MPRYYTLPIVFWLMFARQRRPIVVFELSKHVQFVL